MAGKCEGLAQVFGCVQQVGAGEGGVVHEGHEFPVS